MKDKHEHGAHCNHTTPLPPARVEDADLETLRETLEGQTVALVSFDTSTERLVMQLANGVAVTAAGTLTEQATFDIHGDPLEEHDRRGRVPLPDVISRADFERWLGGLRSEIVAGSVMFAKNEGDQIHNAATARAARLVQQYLEGRGLFQQ